jgi:hypothetical protein
MTKDALITIFNTVQKKFDDEVSEAYFWERLKPYANVDGFIDSHKLAMFAHNETLATSKGFLFEILCEILVNETDNETY